MKKLLLVMIALTMLAMLISPAVIAADEAFPITPTPIGPGNDAPSVYLAARFFDLGIDVDGSGSSINPVDIRNSFYAFTGEQILYYVLVRDDNGAEDINLVKWVKNGTSAQMGPCVVVPVIGVAPKANFSVGDYQVNIAQATNLQYDNQTDKVYKCILTVELNWGGADPGIYVQADDTAGANGKTLQERWTFNPPLTVDIDTSDEGPLTFGEVMKDQDVPGVTAPNCLMNISEDLTSRDCTKYNPTANPQKKCDIQFSTNKIVLTNLGIPDLWPFIAATDFYDSTGMAKCPFTNSLSANQFEYRALQGTWDSGWRVMPEYALALGCNGPTLFNQCRGGCRITVGCPIDIIGTGDSIDVALKVVWPTPCIGNFDDGTIYFIVRAV